ncbi:MAG: methyl-accepting chemotaxis protein, partial [Planctomycetota bacterium]|nr:methyl-accepting chemotaxis protein [Planctomycetota bacterium]
MAFQLIARVSYSEITINGPRYDTLVRDKDLLADVLPPPAFVIESFLTAHELADAEDKGEQTRLVKQLDQLEKDFNARMAHWRVALPPGSPQLVSLEAASEPALKIYEVIRREMIPLVQEGKFDEARVVNDQKVLLLYRQHREIINDVVQAAQAAAAETERAAAAAVSRTEKVTLAVGGATVAAVIALAWVIGRSITGPVRRVADRMADIAEGEGDLTQRVENLDDKSEIGRLAECFNGFARTVHDVIREVREMSGGVCSGTERIAAATEETSRSMQLQTQTVQQIVGAVEELSRFADEVAQQSTSASETASQAGRVAEEGGGIVEKTIESIRSIEEVVSAGAERVTSLGSRSDQIGQIIEVINDIADQTNLLALNAAIEAARAGEHGRGFAVVADEVRKLAERTTHATKEVADAIRQIQSETKDAVARMNEGTERVREGVRFAGDASAGLTRIVDSVRRTSQAISEIVGRVKRQAELGSQIREQISSVSASADEVARANASTSEAAAELNSRGQALARKVEQFMVDRRGKNQDRTPARP